MFVCLFVFIKKEKLCEKRIDCKFCNFGGESVRRSGQFEILVGFLVVVFYFALGREEGKGGKKVGFVGTGQIEIGGIAFKREKRKENQQSRRPG